MNHRMPWHSNADPTYSVGDIIRYCNGSSALMRVDSIHHAGSDNPRYYGLQCCGGIIGAYHNTCERPSKEDMKTWRELAKMRKP